MNIDINITEQDYIESIIEQIINSTNQRVDPVEQAALDIADSISSLGESISNMGNVLRSQIRPRPIIIPIPSFEVEAEEENEQRPRGRGLEHFVNQILQIPTIEVPPNQTLGLPQWLFDPSAGTIDRRTINIDRLNELCPEEEGDSIECNMECNSQVTLQRKLPCDHVFCSRCIVRWMTENSNTCPICRQVVN